MLRYVCLHQSNSWESCCQLNFTQSKQNVFYKVFLELFLHHPQYVLKKVPLTHEKKKATANSKCSSHSPHMYKQSWKANWKHFCFLRLMITYLMSVWWMFGSSYLFVWFFLYCLYHVRLLLRVAEWILV